MLIKAGSDSAQPRLWRLPSHVAERSHQAIQPSLRVIIGQQRQTQVTPTPHNIIIRMWISFPV